MIEFDRNQGIGGSDVPAIVGLSPYRSAIDLWDEKRGDAIPREPTLRMRLGTLLEDGIARIYAEQESVKLTKPSKPYGTRLNYDAERGPILEPIPYLTERLGYPTWAQVDRVRVGRPRRGVEIKHTADPRRFAGDVPDDVAVQVQHAMLVTGWSTFDVVSLSAGRDLKVTTVDADPDVHAAIQEACIRFWQQVQTGVMPDPDGSDAAGRFIRERYNAVDPGKIAVATHDVLPQIAHILAMTAARREVEQQLEAAKQSIMLFMGDAEQLDAPGDVRITWKQQDGRHDWKAIAGDLRRFVEEQPVALLADMRLPDGTTATVGDWLDFIESMHVGQPTRVFRVTGKAVAL